MRKLLMAARLINLVPAVFFKRLNQFSAMHQHPYERYAEILNALRTDPYNRTRQHPIKKLEAVAEGLGQYRIRSGRFRFRYDISGQEVYLIKSLQLPPS